MNTLTVFVVIAEKGQHVSGSGVDVKCQVYTENVRGELLCRGSTVPWSIVINQLSGGEGDLAHIVSEVFIGIAKLKFNIGILFGQLEKNTERRTVCREECHRTGVTGVGGRLKAIGVPFRVPVFHAPVVPVVVLVVFHFFGSEIAHIETLGFGNQLSEVYGTESVFVALNILQDLMEAFFRTMMKAQLIGYMVRHDDLPPLLVFSYHEVPHRLVLRKDRSRKSLWA